MDVILLEKMGKIGDVGDQVSVKSGFARNYLFPQSKAIPATKQNIAEFEVRKDELMKAAAEKMTGEKKRAAQLAGILLTIEVNASEEGKLYGSVGTREIADAATAGGHEIDKSEVELPEGALQHVGEYDVTIMLSPEVSTEIKVAVVSVGTDPDGIIEADEDSSTVETVAEQAGDAEEPKAE